MSPLATLEQSAQPALGDRTSLLLPRVARVNVWTALVLPNGVANNSLPIQMTGFNAIMAVVSVVGAADLDLSVLLKDPRDPFNFLAPYGPFPLASWEIVPAAPATYVLTWGAFGGNNFPIDSRANIFGNIEIQAENFGPVDITSLTIDLFLGKR
jgi:hypothetical protein